MTEIEAAWLAGILEGEGCFFFNRTPMIKLQMTDEDVVARAAALMGKNYRKSKRPTISGKSVYSFEIHGEKALNIMRLILEHMGARRSAKIKEVMELAAARSGVAVGERQGHAKLTNEQALLILTKWKENPSRGIQSQIAREYNVTSQSIGFLIRRQTWKHLDSVA